MLSPPLLPPPLDYWLSGCAASRGNQSRIIYMLYLPYHKRFHPANVVYILQMMQIRNVSAPNCLDDLIWSDHDLR